MEIRFTGQNLSVTEGMQAHLKEKVSKLDRYAPRIMECHVVLKKQKYFYEVELTLRAKNLRAYGKGKSKENVYVAIDQAYERIEKQLKKYREKVKTHHKVHGEDFTPKVQMAQKLNSEPSLLAQRPDIVHTKEFASKPMSTEEASLQLELSDKPFLVFMNASIKKINVIYKREDGNHGLIEPGF